MWTDLLLAAAASGGPPVSEVSAERFSVARIELIGPLSELQVRTEFAQAHWSVDVRRGERIGIDVALALAAAERPTRPELVWRGDGEARFDTWDEAAATRRVRAWSDLPDELRARPACAPPVERAPRACWSAVAAALAGALAVLAARTRTRLALACSVVSAALAGGLASYAPAPRSIRIVEVDGGSGAAVAVEAGRAVLRGARLEDLRWDVGDARQAVATSAVRGVGEVTLSARARWLRRWSAFEPGGRSLGPDVNEWGLLSPVWRRDASGEWRELGAWPRGVVLDSNSGQSGREPPGWLNPGLPTGVHVVIGRWLDASDARTGQHSWVRWVGR